MAHGLPVTSTHWALIVCSTAPSRPGQRAANDSHDEKNSRCKVLVISCVHLECLDTEKRRIRDRGKL